METISVSSQAEYDALPEDYNGCILVKGNSDIEVRGSADDTIMIDKVYYNRLREQTTWISVKDRLPEMDVNVLVYTELKNTFVTSRVDAEIWEDDYGYFLAENVTHWRPLPEPPESEE